MALYLATSLLPVLREARNWRPDVVHAHFAVPTGPLALAAKRIHRHSLRVDGALGRRARRRAGTDRSFVPSSRTVRDPSMASCAVRDGGKPLCGRVGDKSLWGDADRNSQWCQADRAAPVARPFSATHCHGGAIEHSEKPAPCYQGIGFDQGNGLVVRCNWRWSPAAPKCGRSPSRRALADA